VFEYSLFSVLCEKSVGVVGSGFDDILERVGIVALDMVDARCELLLLEVKDDEERDVLYAAFNFCRLGLRALERVLERDFFHAEDWLVGVLGVMGVARSVGVRGGRVWFADWAKGSKSRKECVLVADADSEAEKVLDRAERLALVDVTREARREDFRTGCELVLGRFIIDALEGMAGV